MHIYVDFEIIAHNSYLIDWCIHAREWGFKYHRCTYVNNLFTIYADLNVTLYICSHKYISIF